MLNQDKKTVNPLAVGIAGAIIGVVGGAAAMALSDEKNRKQLGKKVAEWKDNAMNLKDQAIDKVQTISNNPDELKDKADEKLHDARRKLSYRTGGANK